MAAIQARAMARKRNDGELNWSRARAGSPDRRVVLVLCADCGIESLLSLDSDNNGVDGGPAARSAEQPRV